MKRGLLTLLFLPLALTSLSQDFNFDVRNTYEHTRLKSDLIEAKNLLDINPHHPISWIDSYITVELSAVCNGQRRTARSKSDQLSLEQLSILDKIDYGTDLEIHAKYHPINRSGDDDIREINLSFTIIPQREASYKGSYTALKRFLQEEAFDHLSENELDAIEIVEIKFVIDENGRVIHPVVATSSGSPETDNLLMRAVKNLPRWNPAKDFEGNNIQQEFKLIAGTMTGC